MAYNIYLLLEGNIYTKIVGVTAEATEDITNYDNSLYDLSASAGFYGGTPLAIGTTYTTLPNVPEIGKTSVVNESTLMNQDITAATKEIPAAQSRKRTRYKWTTATGAYWAWADQIRCVSTTPFTFSGGTIPSLYDEL
jgi:hypothetical protein